MKSSAIIFCVIALGGLGQSQKCTADTAINLEDLLGNLETSAGGSTSSLDTGASGGTSSLADTSGGDISGDLSSDIISSADLATLENEQNLNDLQSGLNDAIVQSGESIKDLTARSRLSRSLLDKRADFTCSGTETCFSIDSQLYCGDLESGDVRSAEGISGNFYTGDFELPNGTSGNVASVSFPLIPSVTLDPIIASPSTKATAAKNSAPTTTDDTKTESKSAATATATATAATDGPSSADASATSKASALTSALSSLLQSRSAASSSTGSAGAASSTAEAANPGNAASALELSTPAMMSFIAAASLLWRIFLV